MMSTCRRRTTDPQDELFDVLDPDGQPLGHTKARAEVHRDGDWHRAFHLWVAWHDAAGSDWLLLQRRSMTKDTWPGRVDVAVGGHFGVGEMLPDVLREVGEELGFVPALQALRRVETRRVENRSEQGFDREFQEVYLLVLESLPVLRPNPIELMGVLRVAVTDFILLAASQTPAIVALAGELDADGHVVGWSGTTLTLTDLVPANDGYWERLAETSQQWLTSKP